MAVKFNSTPQSSAYIALLRGINVSGQKLVKMVDLQSHFASCGATSVQTYIQSGNVIFNHSATTTANLRQTLEQLLAAKLGFAVPIMVKTVNELAAIAAANPYDPSSPEFGKKMCVCIFEKSPSQEAIESIRPWINSSERLVVKGPAAYAYYADGLGRAKLSSAVIERKLGLATLRNWNTVTALLQIAKETNRC